MNDLDRLQKLQETNTTVAALQIKVTEFQPIVLQKAKDAEEMLKKVALDQKEADITKAEVEAEEALVAADAAVVREQQADAEKDLAEALPALKAAVKAVDSLDKKDISEMKALQNPPAGVRMVMEAICCMFGIKNDWDSAKKMMAQSDFLKSLQDYKAEQLTPQVSKKLQPYLTNELFTEEKMFGISQAAAALCKWTLAMVVYSRISREVEPKKQKLREMTAALKEKEALLAAKRAALQAVLDKVAALQKQLEDTLKDKQYWVDQMAVCQRQLVTASKLTVGLADEEVRWAKDAIVLRKQVDDLVGDAFISAGCISYFGPFTGEYVVVVVVVCEGGRQGNECC